MIRGRALLALVGLLAVALTAPASAQVTEPPGDSEFATTDHYVLHRSSVPVIKGQPVRLYVREKVLRDTPPSKGAVLFVHGATYPTETAFDLPYEDYSWMEDMAAAGFQVFSVDMEGYGRSSRPWPMEDPCNLSAANQLVLIPDVIAAPCDPSHPFALTTNRSDIDALDRVVDFIRSRGDVDRVNLVGWSQGGTRTGGYAAAHPDKVDRMVLLAPAYDRNSPAETPAIQPAGAPFAIQTKAGFTARWDAQVSCEGQFDPAAREAMWQQNLEFDPVGATWGPGVVRRPINAGGGWNRAAAARVKAPTLLLEGDLDIDVVPERVRELYEDLGSRHKVFALIHCNSHFSAVESDYRQLQKAAREWLLEERVAGKRRGTVPLG